MSYFFVSIFEFITSNIMLSFLIFMVILAFGWLAGNYFLSYVKLLKVAGMLASFFILTVIFLLMDEDAEVDKKAHQIAENKKKSEKIKKDIEKKQGNDSVQIELLQDVVKNFTCKYYKPLRMKSMQQGFFVPFEKSFDLLMLNQGPSEFIVYLRSREDNKVIKTMYLELEQPIVMTLLGKQYQISYEEKEGLTKVVSVIPCYCLKNKKANS